jgi:hypothetical protein
VVFISVRGRLDSANAVMKSISALMVLLAVLLPTSCSDVSQTRFDSRQWKSGGKETRGGMVLDLIEHKALIGKSSSAVREILGMPDTEESN